MQTSKRPPAISTPVGPPPTMTNVSSPRSIRSGWASATSTQRRMWFRSRVASANEYSANACSSAPGTSKYAARAPPPMIKKS